MPQIQNERPTVQRRANGSTVRTSNGARVEVRRPTSQVRIEPVTMTPEEAAKIIANSDDAPRRSVSPISVQRIVQEIKDGRWNGRTNFIAFDKNGHLIDGWHRVTAIAEAGRTVVVMVGRGFNADEVNFFDRRTQPRRVRHILQFKNYHRPNDGNIIAAINRLTTGALNSISPEDALSMVERYRVSLDWVDRVLGSSKLPMKTNYGTLREDGKKTPITAPIRATLVFAHNSEEHRADVERFVNELLSYDSPAVKDSPASRKGPHVLRVQLERGEFRGGGSLAQNGVMFRALRCIAAFVDGEDVGKLKTPDAYDQRLLVERFA
jgi:hypothetical protein